MLVITPAYNILQIIISAMLVIHKPSHSLRLTHAGWIDATRKILLAALSEWHFLLFSRHLVAFSH